MKLMTKTTIILALIVAILFSAAIVTPWSVDEETHATEIEQIDKEIDMVLKLTAGATGASAAISLLPDDQCTPIAEELADLAKMFLVVLSALYLEKYLLTYVGTASFLFIIPIALLCVGISLWIKKDTLRMLAVKLVVFAVAIYCVIPISVRCSAKIYNNYEASFEATILETDRIMLDNSDSDAGYIERFTSWISNAAVSVMEYVTGLLSQFVDAIAVMIVTSCLIPIIVIIILQWMLKTLLSFGHTVETVKS